MTISVVLKISPTMPQFFDHWKWLVTLHVTLNVVIDVLVTSALCYYLLKQKTTFRRQVTFEYYTIGG